MLNRRFALTTAVIFAIGGASLATQVAARGPDDGPRHMPSFAELDANGDGQLTVAEFETAAAARFAAADTDGNGALSPDELSAQAQRDVSDRMQRRIDRMVSRMDENGDGALSMDEMRPRGPGPERMIKRMDENGDGTISQEEFDAMADRHGKRGGKHGHGKRGHGHRGGDQSTD
ncbi:MAG: EF-hand domain-containing protein [Paracoccaceae bacterium]